MILYRVSYDVEEGDTINDEQWFTSKAKAKSWAAKNLGRKEYRCIEKITIINSPLKQLAVSLLNQRSFIEDREVIEEKGTHLWE